MGALAEQPATAGGTEAGGRQNPHKESCSRLEEESPGGPASPAQFLSMLVMEGREEPAPCAACGSGRPAGPEAHGGPRRARGGGCKAPPWSPSRTRCPCELGSREPGDLA